MNSTLAKLAFVVIVFCLIGGIIALVGGISDFNEAGKTNSQPQVITAARLAEHGPGDNHYVEITEVAPRIESIIVEGGDRKTFWHKAYIPLSSAGEDPDSKSPPRIILITESVKDQASLDKLATGHSIIGMVGQWDVTLDNESRNLLHEAYPKMDTTKCLIVSHGATPPSKLGAVACIVLGIALLATMLVLGTAARRGKWGEYLAPKKLATFGVTPLFQPPIQPQPQRQQPPQPQPPPRLASLPEDQKWP